MSRQNKREMTGEATVQQEVTDAHVEAELVARAEALRQPRGGERKDEIRAARTVIIAAKAAYQFKSPRWLSLFSRAMSAIEECPAEVRNRLKEELCVFHPQWHKRPRTI